MMYKFCSLTKNGFSFQLFQQHVIHELVHMLGMLWMPKSIMYWLLIFNCFGKIKQRLSLALVLFMTIFTSWVSTIVYLIRLAWHVVWQFWLVLGPERDSEMCFVNCKKLTSWINNASKIESRSVQLMLLMYLKYAWSSVSGTLRLKN